MKDLLAAFPERTRQELLIHGGVVRRIVGGDVKRLTNFTPEYRLRVGDYRVLFEIEDTNRVVVYRVCHRREAYRG